MAAPVGFSTYMLLLKSWVAAELGRERVPGAVGCPMKSPVGGGHNQSWLDCDGDVYEKAVPDVNAAHSLEYGAVWVIQRQGRGRGCHQARRAGPEHPNG